MNMLNQWMDTAMIFHADSSLIEFSGGLLVLAALLGLYFTTYRVAVYWFVAGVVYWLGIEAVALGFAQLGISGSSAYVLAISLTLALLVFWLGLKEALNHSDSAPVFMEHTPLNGEVPTSKHG